VAAVSALLLMLSKILYMQIIMMSHICVQIQAPHISAHNHVAIAIKLLGKHPEESLISEAQFYLLQ
jgi:hypothetical protein